MTTKLTGAEGVGEACPIWSRPLWCAVNIGDGNAYRYREVVQSNKRLWFYSGFRRRWQKCIRFTSQLLSGPGFVHSTRDKPLSTRLRAIEAKSQRQTLESSSGIFVIFLIAGTTDRAVNDGNERLIPLICRETVE
jgi:hypothetical protein